MAKSSIEWTQMTWNPTTGCTKLGKECENCYAEKETNRFKSNPQLKKYHAGFDVVVEHRSTLQEPLRWKKPTVVFVDSMSDLFHDDVSLGFIKDVFKVMNNTPQHTYQVLTKRAKNLTKYSNDLEWTHNIWMGVSVGVNATKHRVQELQKCGAKNKFISVEPLLEQIDEMNIEGIDLVIVGGESGHNNARPIEKDWVVKVKDICDEQNVPFFFKQWGKLRNNPDPNDPTQHENHTYHAKGGCMLDAKLYLSNPSLKGYQLKTLDIFGSDYYVMDDYFGLNTIWELKSYLPEMEDELFKQLKADIKTNGLNDPIIYTTLPNGQKLVIEGHTRLRAAIELKLKEFPTKEITDSFNNIDDIKLWMIRHQFQRRNLSNVEKLQLAFHSKETIEKRAKENLSKGGKNIDVNEHIDTSQEIAKIAGVSRATVVRYTNVINNAPKSMKVNMLKGDISISAASKNIDKKAIKKKTPTVKEKEEPKIKLVKSYGEGIELLNNAEIDSIVVLKDIEQIESFTTKQKTSFGFLIVKRDQE
jgi:protein gp37